jgi:hypothetical protein
MHTELSEQETRRTDNIVVRPALSPRNVASSARPQYDTKGYIDPEFGLRSPDHAHTSDLELKLGTRDCAERPASEHIDMVCSQHYQAGAQGIPMAM